MGRILAGVTATALIAAAGCSVTPPGAGQHAGRVSPGRPTSWAMYHANAARTGFVPGLPAAGRLAIGWTRRLDGAVYGQPLVVAGVVIAATENDSVYGIDRSTGRVRWRTHLGTPLPLSGQQCGNIDPLGITSTPVYDRGTGLVYALAQIGRTGHLLAGLDPRTGRPRYLRAVPSPDRQPAADQQRGALAAGNGRIYVTFGGHFGDCGDYAGSVVAVPAAGHGPIVSYLVPTARQAGIWAPGGPVIGPGGTVYVSVGNGSHSPRFDGSDSVTALSPALRRIGLFAPSSWQADNTSDLDLGSMSPALIAGRWILAVGKRGTGYLLRARHLGGIGGQVASLAVCSAFGGAAVAGNPAGASTVYVPCGEGGLAALAVSPGQITLAWRGPGAADGSPVVGGGAVWVTDNSDGVLYELSEDHGVVMSKLGLGIELPHFTSPSLSGRLVLIGTMHGIIAMTGA
jgi:outer membrane protein assembly factor BamB